MAHVLLLYGNEIVFNKTDEDSEYIAGTMSALILVAALNNTSSLDERKYQAVSMLDLSQYRLLYNVPAANISVPRITKGDYAVWIRGSIEDKYNLYTFSGHKFMLGFLETCITFEVDYGRYVYGAPFDSEGNEVSIPGYFDLELPTEALGYTTEDYEEEIDEEEDENITNPYQHLIGDADDVA